MPNIMINQICNLRCRYCFADETVNQDQCKENDMTFDNFKKAVALSLERPGRIGIIGGEPTLHPQFVEFVEYAASTGAPVTIFSNGIKLREFWKLFLKGNVCCLWNVNGPDISGPLFKEVEKSMEFLFGEMRLQSHFTLGLNLYEKDMPYQFFVDLCKKYRIKGARLAITVPNTKSDRGAGYLDRIRSMKDLLIEVCEALAEVGTIPHLDCTMLPPCVVTEEDKVRIGKFHDKLNVTYRETRFFDYQPCQPIVDIMPDLSVTRCFGCSDMGYLKYREDLSNIKTSEWYSIGDAHNVFAHTIDDLGFVIPGHQDCVTCQFRMRGICRGGCLGYKKYVIKDAMNYLGSRYGGVNPYAG